MPAAFARFARLEGKDRLLLVEAVAALALASMAIRLVPFRRLAGALSPGTPRRRRAPRRDTDAADDVTRRAVWAVNAAARRASWRAVCFQRGLALHSMLRRRGLDSRLHYGVAKPGAEGLRAHVWVSHEGRTLIGGEEAKDFVCLATFPSSTQAAPQS